MDLFPKKTRSSTSLSDPVDSVRPRNALPILSQNKQPSEPQSKQRFLEAIRALSGPSETLRKIVSELLNAGYARNELIQWAVDAGYREKYVRSLLSAVLTASGTRARKAGAGRRVSQEALSLPRSQQTISAITQPNTSSRRTAI